MRIELKTIILLIGLVSPRLIAAPAEGPAAAAVPVLLIHLPGVAGESWVDHALVKGLCQSELPLFDVVIHDWTGRDAGLAALADTQRHAHHADLVARRITEHRQAHPDVPVVLTSHSGGAGIAVWALERLPEGVAVQNLVLIAPALSPGYDLSRALARVERSAFALTSPLDGVVLGAGTRLFGTIDRVKTDAAGRVGFIMPQTPAVPGHYQKLVPLRYDAKWIRLGNLGDHLGPMASPFAKTVIAGLLLTGRPPEVPAWPFPKKAAGSGPAPSSSEPFQE